MSLQTTLQGLRQMTPAAAPLHSPRWFRVAALRPQLHLQVQVQRQVLRGEVWHTLLRNDGTRHFRLNAGAWSAVARCDGARTLQQVWDMALAEAGPDAPHQDELMAMLARLHEAGLMSFDRSPDFGNAAGGVDAANTDWLAHAAGAARAPTPVPAKAPAHAGQAQHRQSLLAWRMPLGNPDRWLQRLQRLLPLTRSQGQAAFMPTTAIGLWWAAVLTAGWAAALHARELHTLLQPLLAAPHAWGLAWVAYPVLKLLHELAHGLAARVCGAAVPQWGITWMMGVPVPYVDASAASALPHRRQRMLVAGAGIAAELAVAALALAVALQAQPGTLRDATLLVFAMAVLSAAVVNLNPLLRFDGYHLLCDAAGLPNLAPRSSQFWLQKMRGDAAPGLRPAPGEAPWLWAYAPAALAMRVLVATAVVLWLGGVSQALGWLALLGFATHLVLAPLWRLAQWLRAGGWQALGRSAHTRSLTLRQLGLLAATGCLLAAALWPVPDTTVVQGVLLPPAQTQLRAQTPGFVQQLWVADGQTVAQGDAVLQLHAPELQAQRQRLQGHVQDLQAEQMRKLRDEPAAAAAAAHALQAAQSDLDLTELRLQQLTLRAPAAGRISIEHAADLAGRHVQRGALLAQVLTGQPGTVSVAIAHEHAARLLAGGSSGPSGTSVQTGPSGTSVQTGPSGTSVQSGPSGLVQLLGPEPGAQPRAGRWLGAPSGGQVQLPSAALGQRSGGRLAVDSADPQGLRPAQAVLIGQVELLPDPTPARPVATPRTQHEDLDHRLGQRMLVRIEHGRTPLLLQAAQAVQQALLHHFNPST